MTYKLKALMSTDWKNDTTWTSQLTLVLWFSSLYFCRHEASAENGRYDTANYSVEREGEEHLVSMQGQGRQAERIGIW